MNFTGYLKHLINEDITSKLDEFTRQYIETALWSSTGDDEEPLDKNFDISDIADEAMKSMIADCKKFQDENRELYEKGGWDDGQAGHDFWLTRNGHGAGFWDRHMEGMEKDIGDQLTEKAHKFGEVNLYVGDDGKIYQG